MYTKKTLFIIVASLLLSAIALDAHMNTNLSFLNAMYEDPTDQDWNKPLEPVEGAVSVENIPCTPTIYYDPFNITGVTSYIVREEINEIPDGYSELDSSIGSKTTCTGSTDSKCYPTRCSAVEELVNAYYPGF